MVAQRTIARAVGISGRGLHGGKPVSLWLEPAAADTGVVFVRDGVELPARLELVADTRAATTLARGGARVGTVEHLLAAAHGLGVHDLRVVLDADEPPALDGGAAGFVALLREAGLRELEAELAPLSPRRTLEVEHGAARARVEPGEALSISYRIDYPHPSLGTQQREFSPGDGEDFAREIAPARTFGFARDAEALARAGLARGVSLDNTVVLDDEGVRNEGGWRWPDEAVRHKILDLLGDLVLLGRPLAARVTVERGGHELHRRLVAALRGAETAERSGQ